MTDERFWPPRAIDGEPTPRSSDDHAFAHLNRYESPDLAGGLVRMHTHSDPRVRRAAAVIRWSIRLLAFVIAASLMIRLVSWAITG
jgi:hypothetical protein